MPAAGPSGRRDSSAGCCCGSSWHAGRWPCQRSGGPRFAGYRFASADPRGYEAASRLWDEHRPANYNLDIEVTGNRPGRIHVEVRDGQAIQCLRDGVEPSQRRTWYYWTVPGMLDMIGQELDKVDDPAAGFGASGRLKRRCCGPSSTRAWISTPLLRSIAGQNLDMGWTAELDQVSSRSVEQENENGKRKARDESDKAE